MGHLGPRNHYSDFLAFFKEEIEKSSWQEVLQQYVFAGDKRANDMLVRMYAGVLHPIIHLGFGIEFQQPAVISEALAQAACHDNSIGKFLLPAEKAAKGRAGQSKPIAQLLDEMHADKEIQQAPRWLDTDKIQDGLLARAGDRMIDYASRVTVQPDELERKTAEMINACALFTGGAQRSDKALKFDFFFIHCVNASIFWSSFLKQQWLDERAKVRLLEWKMRLDLALYASQKAPEVRLEEIRGYQPKVPSGWDGVEDRVCAFDDDGHASKLVRALAHAEKVCKPYESSEEFRPKGGDWLQLAHMAMDSVEMAGNNWIMMTGFDEAWENVPARSHL